MRLAIPMCAAAALSGCGADSGSNYTLYRSSIFDPGARVHWATFNAKESNPAYNLNNCQMAARLLNANYRASSAEMGKLPDPHMGFWCEPGAFHTDGSIPVHFSSAFPTDV
nr:hypothetical protein [Sphingomonas sp. SCN 67-18]